MLFRSGGDPDAKRQRFLNWQRRVVFLDAARRKYIAAILDWFDQPTREQMQRLGKKMRRVLHRLGIQFATVDQETQSEPPRQREISRAYNHAFDAYVPERFDGAAILLWPEDDKPTTPRGAAAGWADVCREVELIYVPGEHHSSVSRHGCLVKIGEQIQSVLSRTATSKLEALIP